MHRTLALLAGLLAPLAAVAQTVPTTANTIAFLPAAFGDDACTNSSTTAVSLAWTITPTTVPAVGSVFRIEASTDSECAATNASTGVTTGEIVDNLTLTTDFSGTYPGTTGDTLVLSQFLTAAGLDCTAGNVTVHVCVHINPQVGSDANFSGIARGTIAIQHGAPAVPVLNSPLGVGDSSLTASWHDGPSNGVAVDHYRVVATVVPPDVDGGSPHTADTANATTQSLKVTGLINGLLYSVTVASVSSGGNPSAPSTPLQGSPQPVDDFWAIYTKDGGPEKGGCAGGAGGLLSLLGLLGLARTLRRRS